MICTPSFIFKNASSLSKWRVSFNNGVWMVMKSAAFNTSSTVPNPIPIFCAFSSVRNGSYAITFIRCPFALAATSAPILPRPMTPSVLFFNSTPMNDLRSHCPFFNELNAWGIFRANAVNIAIVCSAAEFVLPSGALTTMMPCSVAASKSILSTPTPARPIIFRLLAASITSRVTCVWLRTSNASKPLILSSRASFERSVATVMSRPFRFPQRMDAFLTKRIGNQYAICHLLFSPFQINKFYALPQPLCRARYSYRL